MFYLLSVIFISMGISALCSLFEACLLSMSHRDIADLSLDNDRLASTWKIFKDNIQKPIAVILIINTIAHTTGASLSGAKFDQLFGPKWIIAYSFVFSFAMIQWTEILPKTLGVTYKKRIAVFMTLPLLFLIKFFTPVVKLIEIINSPFTRSKNKSEKYDALKELSMILKYAVYNNQISQDQDEIISRTIQLKDKKAKDIMIPAKEMKVLSTNMTMAEALIEAHIHNHTRLPIADNENPGSIIGYINFKDIVSALKINPVNPSLSGILRPIMKIDEDESYSNVFKKITLGHQHIAIVKNKKNEIKGLITLEDVIEEIIGKVEDEYDILPSHLYPITNDRYIAGGGVRIKQIAKQFGADMSDGDMIINDWFADKFGKTLKPGDAKYYGNIKFIIKKISRSRIFELIIQKMNE